MGLGPRCDSNHRALKKFWSRRGTVSLRAGPANPPHHHILRPDLGQRIEDRYIWSRLIRPGEAADRSHNVFCNLIDCSVPNVHPYGNLAIRGDGNEPINAWANSPRIEELRAAGLNTADLEQKAHLRRFAEAALGRGAAYPDGQVLAGNCLPQTLD